VSNRDVRIAPWLVSLVILVAARGQINTSQPATENASLVGRNQPEWDPVSCWDCPKPEDPERLFFAGLCLALPISVVVIRRRTRKREALQPNRVFEI
jgi:hypothetical protein